RAVGLEARRGIGKRPRAAVELEAIAHTRMRPRDEPAKVPTVFGRERRATGLAFEHHVDPPALGRPHSKMRSLRRRLAPDRKPPLHVAEWLIPAHPDPSSKSLAVDECTRARFTTWRHHLGAGQWRRGRCFSTALGTVAPRRRCQGGSLWLLDAQL